MCNRFWNGILIFVSLLIMGVFAFYVREGVTADAVVVLRTTGMTCGSCGQTVTRALQAERGVASAEVDLERGVVFAGFDSRQTGAERLARSVTSLGYQSRVEQVVTPEQFKKMAGRDLCGRKVSGSGCCGTKGCGGR